jgi:hypothetical protein
VYMIPVVCGSTSAMHTLHSPLHAGHEWKLPIRALLLALSSACIAMNASSSALDLRLATNSSGLASSVTAGSYLVLILFIATVVLLVYGFGRAMHASATKEAAKVRGEHPAARDALPVAVSAAGVLNDTDDEEEKKEDEEEGESPAPRLAFALALAVDATELPEVAEVAAEAGSGPIQPNACSAAGSSPELLPPPHSPHPESLPDLMTAGAPPTPFAELLGGRCADPPSILRRDSTPPDVVPHTVDCLAPHGNDDGAAAAAAAAAVSRMSGALSSARIRPASHMARPPPATAVAAVVPATEVVDSVEPASEEARAASRVDPVPRAPSRLGRTRGPGSFNIAISVLGRPRSSGQVSVRSSPRVGHTPGDRIVTYRAENVREGPDGEAQTTRSGFPLLGSALAPELPGAASPFHGGDATTPQALDSAASNRMSRVSSRAATASVSGVARFASPPAQRAPRPSAAQPEDASLAELGVNF